MIKNILIGFLLVAVAYFAWIATTIEADPLQRTYNRYNHMKIYEDGSFTGEDRDGNAVDGCLPNALCQD